MALVPARAIAAVAQGCSNYNGSYGPNFQITGPEYADGLVVGDVVTVTALTFEQGRVLEVYDASNNANLVLLASSTPNVNSSSVSYTVTAATAGRRLLTVISGSLGPHSSATWSCMPTAAGANSDTNSGTKPGASKIVVQRVLQSVQTLVANPYGSTRQVDRLLDFDNVSSIGGVNAGTGFGAKVPSADTSQDGQRRLDPALGNAGASRLGLGGGISREPVSSGLSLRSSVFDDDGPGRVGGPVGSSRTSSGGVNVAGLSVSGSNDDGANLNFSTSLRDMARANAQQERQRLADDPEAAALGARDGQIRKLNNRPNPLDVWVEGRFLALRDGRNNADIQGHSGLYAIGTDYVFNRNVLAGVSLSFDSSGQKSGAQSWEARSRGWLVGPYATIRVAPDLFWQSRLAYGQAQNEVSPDLTALSSYSSQRWLGMSKLIGRYQYGPWQLRPSTSVAYMDETTNSYIDTAGANVEGVKARLGLVTAGPEIIYRYWATPSLLLEPRLGLDLIWTFVRDVSSAGGSLIGPDAVGPGGMRGRVELGMRAMMAGGLGLDFSGSYDGVGIANYSNVTGRAVVRVPLN